MFHVKQDPMDTLKSLADSLRALDGSGYKAYKKIEGPYAATGLVLHVDHVQGDPFAEPSRFRAEVAPEAAALPAWAFSTPDRRRATADFVNRLLADALEEESREGGSGKSGELRVLRPGQQVLARASLVVSGDGAITARVRVGLPARGRRILGKEASALVTEALPRALRASLLFQPMDEAALRVHVETVEDSVALRAQLEDAGLVAFVAEGASLPRRSGIDDHPLGDAAIPFVAPSPLRVVLEAPNAGAIPGLGVPEGVTLIVGGGYHGKSTLLRAIERGVYDHIPGDGRERVVAVPSAVKVRAEDGRRVTGVDISNFIGDLPSGEATARFSTDNASGSTSQASAIAEALEAGAGCLLLDEDTSATNFMIRDARMQALIADADEPITPFIDRARQLHRELGVSSVVVVGGSGDYFDVADTVIAMREYRPSDVTDEARGVAERIPTQRSAEGGSWTPVRARRVDPGSIDPSRGHRDVSIRVRSRDRVEFGRDRVDLAGIEQLVETAQTRAIAYALERGRHGPLADLPLRDALKALVTTIEERGLHWVHPYEIGELAEFRVPDAAAFLNRLRSLRLSATEEEK